nr:translation initiation factor eif-2b subunit alpha [Quercus suber]
MASPSFDVVEAYHRVLKEDPDITMPVAAIEALILGLSKTTSSTVSETLHVVRNLTEELKQHIPNSISLSAGTDLCQQYLLSNLQKPSAGGDFEQIRASLVQSGREIVQRAKAARNTIGGLGKSFVRDGNVVLTNGGSRVVGAMLRSAAETTKEKGSIRFQVIYVVSPSETSSEESESEANIAALRARGIPVATVPPTAVAYCMNQVTQCFVGAEGVMENGGVVSRLGTYQMGILAKNAGKPFYVVAETHKFVRLYPMGQDDLGISQNIINFKTADDEGRSESKLIADEGVADMDGTSGASPHHHPQTHPIEEAVDYTPPHYISGIITESGVLVPSALLDDGLPIRENPGYSDAARGVSRQGSSLTTWLHLQGYGTRTRPSTERRHELTIDVIDPTDRDDQAPMEESLDALGKSEIYRPSKSVSLSGHARVHDRRPAEALLGNYS